LLVDDLELEVLLEVGERAAAVPMAIGTVDSWNSSTRPRRVSDLAKSGGTSSDADRGADRGSAA
jgi:hypothetical protein